MKTFVSYSVAGNEEFILTLLSSRLREKDFTVGTSQYFYNKELDLNTMNEIADSNLFLGIILEGGNEKKRVFDEWEYAVLKNIPNILLIESSTGKDETLTGNFIKFSRSNTKPAINEINQRMIPSEDGLKKSNDVIPWILGGDALISILTLGFPEVNKSKYVISGRLKLIEHQLLSIDSASFQNLCDIYLALREQELASINRTGSQLGKQKTVKGTPDTFFRLADGSLRYVEYSTKADNLVGKIKDDIEKCLDATKTGIPATEIHSIIICYNSRLDVSEEVEITKYADLKNIRITLIGLDWLALEIYSKYLILAKDILGIPLDTGQLLPLASFIEEYNNKGSRLSTPLDNLFLNREKELTDISNILISNDLLIISGFPGVGKTKLAIEAIDKFLSENRDYSAFAVSKKDQDISDDLKIHLQSESNYILLIDDANRQLLNFKQILGIFKERRKGKIKLLITVRDYALRDIENICFEFEPRVIVLNKFTDEEIIQLISSESFEIKNPKYQRKIVEVADGNARLAVMAARIAKERQANFLFGNVSDLYDSYFQTFISDFDIFGNKILIKTLGIISFFFTIERSNKEFIKSLLENFELEYHDFNEAIDELEKRELVEVQYNHARVSEQVMATYFFYKVFIKDEILSFKTLLFAYFPVWKKRFSDTIIPSNNAFGYTNVLNKISFVLDEYLFSVYDVKEKVFEFFTLFWFYKREEVLNYFHKQISALPNPEAPIYNSKYETNDFVYDRNKTIDYLSELFRFYTESFVPALELAFEYVRKQPERFPELIKRIREGLLFDDDDSIGDFQRQNLLFELIISKFKKGREHYIEAFFALANTFLSYRYRITKAGRNHSITFYEYPLPVNENIKNFRRNIWETLFDNYKNYPNQVFQVIKQFGHGHRDSIKELLEFDLTLLIPFIENNLDKNLFEHSYFVHDLVYWLDRTNLTDKSYQKLKQKFTNKQYEYFRKLDWNTLRGKQDYEFDKLEDFESLKEKDIRESFVFSNVDEFTDLHIAIKNIQSLEPASTWGLDQSLNIIVEENFIQNEALGFDLLKSLLADYPIGLNPLSRAVKTIINQSEDSAFKLWQLLKKWNNDSKLYWQLSFYDYLPERLINQFYKDELFGIINSIDKRCYLQFDAFNKFRIIDDKILFKLLQIVVNKIDGEKLSIILSFHFFEKYSKLLSENFELLAKAYLQQEKISHHFDFGNAGLRELCMIKPEFLLEYIRAIYLKDNTINDNRSDRGIGFVWEMDNYALIIEEAINIIVENYVYYGILEHQIIIFFSDLNEEKLTRAKQFILDYITKYNTSVTKMNAVFGVVREAMNSFFETAFLHYLKLNTDLEIFTEIWWRGNGGSYSGDENIGEIMASDWQRILTIVAKSNDQLNLIPIKTYIKRLIKSELSRAEEERKRKFINPEW